MTRIKIKNNSGDRDFFTIVPNYILNHSTSNDQALYLQMKRYAGEDGECFATQETLMKNLGIGKHAYRKSLDYIIKKGWIDFVGLSGGKTRPIKTYKINNIWQENSNYYKKIPSRMAVSKDSADLDGDTVQNGSKIPSRSAIEEEPCEEEPLRRNVAKLCFANLNEIIDLFRNVNPSWKRLFANKTQRGALERLLQEHGEDKVRATIEALPKINSIEYLTATTTPLELEKNLGKIKARISQLKGRANKVLEINIKNGDYPYEGANDKKLWGNL